MSLPWPILNFAKFCCGLGPKGGLAMLVAYFDESGTNGKNSRAVTISGLVGIADQWHLLDRPWKRRLNGIPCFHATDCAAGEKDFRNLSKPECATLSMELCNLLAEQPIIGIGSSVYQGDWDYAASAEMKRQFQTPYHFCFAMTMQQVNDWAKQFCPDEPVAFVFAFQNQYREYADATHKVFYDFRENYPNLGNLSWGEPRCLVPLQAADMYAYETYRELIRTMGPEEPSYPKRENMKVLLNSIEHKNRFFDVEGLHHFSEALDEAIKRP